MIKKTKLKKHLIAGESIGTIESNILNCENGLLDLYEGDLEYYPNGKDKIRLPHIVCGHNTIYLCGYTDISKFKKVLGGQFGAVGIDEANIANMDFINEMFLPRFEYCMLTLNPDDPQKKIYSNIIDRARPVEKYKDDIPNQIKELQSNITPQNGWYYWFFTYYDNPSITKERIDALMESLPPDSVQYKTKIEGIRTKSVGLIFNLQKENIITESQARKFKFKKFCMGIDTSYSQQSKDTVSWIFGGITKNNEYVVLEEITLNNKNKLTVRIGNTLHKYELFSPSDIAFLTNEFYNYCINKWGFFKTVYLDSADQATMTEIKKAKRKNGYIFNIVNAFKKTIIIDRILLQQGWISKGKYLIVNYCKEHIKEHNNYAWKSDKDEPEDGNDHTINASQYAWLPNKNIIGGSVDGSNSEV